MTGAQDPSSTEPAGPPAVRARLFVADPLSAGASVGLKPAQAHYLRHVLRLKAGDVIGLFNGRDGEWTGAIAGFGKGWASVDVGVLRRSQGREPDLWLLFAPIKHARIDYLAQKATELGVSRLQPVITDRTAVSRVNTDRLAANAVEAAQQTGRLTVPEVGEPALLGALLETWPADRRLMFCDESGSGPPVADALAAARDAARLPWAILIGPEGGFSTDELDALSKLPFVMPVSLGPRLLRADTAAVAALACWQAALGDWAGATPGS
ncbi:MAG: 16S rRNA (uracil(1498)-N(3))-methyltransferase [Alphaproteobacteria bacterium]|nr:16S rRNA (uracil(1498)-N(3))-methyltransferase [Alphaproteobacteria bacterium]